MNDNEFWIKVIRCTAFVVSVMIGTIGGCTAYETSVVQDMVSKGADPIVARCGVSIGSSTACIAFAARQ